MRWGRNLIHALVVGAMLMEPLALAAQANGVKEPHSLKRAGEDFREGYAARIKGDLELARAKFTEAVKLAPQIPEGHEALGAVLLQMGKPAEAIPELEAAVKLKPDDAGDESNLALAYAQAGQPAQAIPHFAKAEQLAQGPEPTALGASFHEAYGRALAAVDKPAAAKAEFVAEEAEAGASAELDDTIGSLDAQQANWGDAQARFENALKLDAHDLPARIHLGIVYRQQQELEESLGTLEPAALANPPNAQAELEYGRSLMAAGKDDEAATEFAAALKVNPQLPGAPMELAMVLQRLGRQSEAIPWFQQAVASDPHNVSALTNLGLALTLTGRGTESLECFKKALVLDPNDAVIYKDQGVAHLQLSAFDEAIADFEHALALDPNDPQTHYDLGLAYKFKDRFTDAIAELTKAGQMDPTLQDPPYTLGILLMQMGRLDAAVVELKKAVALRPGNGDAWAILGSTLKQDSRLPEAAEALRKAIPLLPGQPGPRVTLAGVLAEEAAELADQANAAEGAGDEKKADELRAQMKELRTETAQLRSEAAVLARGAVNRQRAEFAMNAGNQLMLRGQIADAIARYQEAVVADGTFAAPHSQLAIAYERQGRANEAAAERAKAEELEKAAEKTVSP